MPFRKMVYECPHEGEDVAVVCGRRKDKLRISEGVLHDLRHVFTGQIVYYYLGSAVVRKLLSTQLHSLLGMSVNGSIGDHDALFLGRI